LDYLKGSRDWHDVNKVDVVHSDVQITCDVLGEHLVEPDPNYRELDVVAAVVGEDTAASSCLAAVHPKGHPDIDHT
jgi:hypothetical protein